MLAFRAIRFLWPFLREMFLGGQTLKEALKTHFWRALFVVLFLASVGANFFAWPRLVEISYAHVQLQRRYGEIMKQCYPNSEPPLVEPSHKPPEHPQSTGKVEPSASAASSVSQEAKEFFDRIRDKEQHP